MRRFTLPLLPLALLLMLFGCTQGGMPAACANSAPDTLSNCVYVAAVLDQNPYECYSLGEDSQKEKCLRDASDSAVKKLLEQMTPEERAKVFAAISGAVDAYGINVPLPPLPAAEPASLGPSPATISPPSGISEADSQAYTQAISSNSMASCATITHASTRASCITQVALQVKNPSVCGSLAQKSDIDICNLYAKGGEQAK